MTPGRSLAEIALEKYAQDEWGCETALAVAAFEDAAAGRPPQDYPPDFVPSPWAHLPYRGGRRMPRMWKIALYWHEHPDAFGQINLDGPPHCFRCRRGGPLETWPHPRDTWNAASGWLDRAHLIDRSAGGLDGPQNIVLLCRACHGGMPSFESGDEDKAIQWMLKGVRYESMRPAKMPFAKLMELVDSLDFDDSLPLGEHAQRWGEPAQRIADAIEAVKVLNGG